MQLIVYSVSGAPRPWRVLLGLLFKEIDYEVRYVDAAKGALKSEAFLRLNPRGTVPVMVTGSAILTESVGILAWLDRAYPQNLLFGDTPAEAAAIWQSTMDSCDHLREASNALLRPIFFENLSKSTAELEKAANAMHQEFGRLETLLTARRFLVSDRPSAADAVAFPEVRLVQRATQTKPDLMAALGFSEPLSVYPSLAAWRSRIEAIDGYEKTYPPHWQS